MIFDSRHPGYPRTKEEAVLIVRNQAAKERVAIPSDLEPGVREVPKPNGHRDLHVIFEWMTAHSFGCSARS